MAYHRKLGRIGVWSVGLRSDDPTRGAQVSEAAAELEELGYGTIWLGGSPDLSLVQPLLSATSRITVGTSIRSIWDEDASALAARHTTLNAAYQGRFILGLGVSHNEAKNDELLQHPLARRPYTAMRTYLDALDSAPDPVPAEQRALAALGPKMLGLARDRALGALPYLVTAEHTAQARESLGADALLAPELKVVLDTDEERGRATAREYLSRYLPLDNYRKSWLRQGFTEDDLAGGGSDRLLDSVYAIGSAETARTRVDEFLAAGADHVAVQVVTEEPLTSVPLEAWRTLAEALPLS